MFLVFGCKLLFCTLFIVNKDQTFLPLIWPWPPHFLALFLLQPSRYSVYTLQHHGGVDPKDLCVAVACLCLMLDIAKVLAIVSCAQDRRFLALGPSTFLVRRILC
jgi:hypothetical protein